VIDPAELLQSAWPALLERLEDAVIIMDRNRTLRFVNERARRLLGYETGDILGGRCRLTTRGMDCEGACPLTFALERGLEAVEDFSTVYRTRDGEPVRLSVTVIPLLDADGGMRGAVEILRPMDPDHGFYLAGDSLLVQGLRRRLSQLARERTHVALVGEAPCRIDVSRALHRLTGLPDDLFQLWQGTWEDLPAWPPGTLYVDREPLPEDPPEGWWVMLGVDDLAALGPWTDKVVAVELPGATDRRVDLPLMLVAWADRLVPGVCIEPPALDRLCRFALERGFGWIESVLATAAAACEQRLTEADLEALGSPAVPVDEMLTSDRPLAALEERMLREVLVRSGWRMQEAADRLGISRVTLWRKLREHGIERPTADANG